ncbi:MAG: hypothetical protein QXX08_05645 [Candidatus Bathyarchaeia archaeon]
MQRLSMSSRILHHQLIGTAVLSSGIKELDDLLGGLKTGELVVFHGSAICHYVTEILCVRSQMRREDGGLDSSVVFIDGGNIFDPYFISETACLYGLKPDEILNSIWVSRAFTSYQLVALITEKLPMFLDANPSRIVVVSDIAALFCDSGIGILEAIKIFNRVVLSLWKLAREQDIVLIVSSSWSSSERKRRLEQFLFGRADIVVGFEETDSDLKISLEKHPSKTRKSAKICLGTLSVQSLL